MYLVIVRSKDAEQKLRDWARSSNCQVAIENNRMKIFEQRSFSVFQMTWSGDWNDVTIWDAWNKRHITG